MKKKKDDFDYLFNKNDNNTKGDKFDNLFKKNNDKDISNIDSEINKILGKDKGINYDNNYYNNKYTKNIKYNSDVPIKKYNSQKVHPNITNINGINLGEKPYDKSSLKPINNMGRRVGGGGLMAIGYEPNKNSIFNDMNFGGFGLNKNNQDNNNRFGYKKDLNPIIMKEKKSDYLFGFNKEDKLSYKNPNIHFGNNFSKFENDNILSNKFNNDHNNVFSRRKVNYFSSPNSFAWGGL